MDSGARRNVRVKNRHVVVVQCLNMRARSVSGRVCFVSQPSSLGKGQNGRIRGVEAEGTVLVQYSYSTVLYEYCRMPSVALLEAEVEFGEDEKGDRNVPRTTVLRTVGVL